MPTLFVSDIHLSAARPGRVRAFLDFVAGPARSADALYVLGDCFDLWLGDDDDTPPHPEALAALAALAGEVPVRVLRGNHDFLLGRDFEARTGCRLMADPSVIEVHGSRVVITHGDVLCTDDVEYQAFRAQARDPARQAQFLAQPLAERAAQATSLRAQSRARSRLKPDDIMDVNASAVTRMIAEHGASHLVHGHTHRPGVHRLTVAGAPAWRLVLGDWYEGDSALAWGAGGFRLGPLSEVLAQR